MTPAHGTKCEPKLGTGGASPIGMGRHAPLPDERSTASLGRVHGQLQSTAANDCL